MLQNRSVRFSITCLSLIYNLSVDNCHIGFYRLDLFDRSFEYVLGQYDEISELARLDAALYIFLERSIGAIVCVHPDCIHDADALALTLAAVEAKFGGLLPRMKWLNFGGGHHITRPGYRLATLEQCITETQKKYGVQVYLEPGEAWALNAGYLVTTVLDTLQNGETSLAILDMSAACHTPDVIEMPYRPPLLDAGDPGEKPYLIRLGGPTCLAGDVVGDYSFASPLTEGQRLIFGDMAIYTTCKNNTFNGMPLPPIWAMDENGTCRELVKFGYSDFKMRLGRAAG